MNNIINARQLGKTFKDGSEQIAVLSGIDFSLRRGEFAAIVGASGSGKSTLLHILAGFEKPSSGVVEVSDQNIFQLRDAAKCRLRNRALGFVYQYHYLLPEFSVLENTAMPLLIRGVRRAEAFKQAGSILDKVKMSHRLHFKPAELSGGERQRVSIARAVVHQPECIIADEPTGNLDSENRDNVFKILCEMQRDANVALLVVTHDESIAAKAETRYLLKDKHLEK